MRLPHGYDKLDAKLGAIIRTARKTKRMKQAALADECGIRRETLSKIERDHRPPRPQVLDALIQVLELDWSDVADLGEPPNARPFVDGYRGNQLINIGKDLQHRRLRQKKSLQRLATELGISAATLSRLERGQSPMSRVFRDRPGCDEVEFESRPVLVFHKQLAAYLKD